MVCPWVCNIPAFEDVQNKNKKASSCWGRFIFSDRVDIICNKNANFVCFPSVFSLSILLSGATEFY